VSLDLSAYADADTVPLTIQPHRAYSTGAMLFDSATGIGGLPVGKIVEVFGPESGGKSTLAYQAAASIQKAGGVVLVLDFENSFLPWYASRVGMQMDPATLLAKVPWSIEEGFEMAFKVTAASAEAGVPCLVIFDSVAAMSPAAVADETATDSNMAGAQRAALLEKLLRKAVGEVARSRAVWIFINHERDNIDTSGGFKSFAQKALDQKDQNKRTPGGKALKYYCAMRIRIAETGAEEKGEAPDAVTGEMVPTVVAKKVTIYLAKNKVAPPFRRVASWIRFGAGFDNAYDLLDVGLARGKIAKSGNTFTFHTGDHVVGQEKARQYLRDHPVAAEELSDSLRKLMEAAWREQADSLLPQTSQEES
jgi:recombination protein RecA